MSRIQQVIDALEAERDEVRARLAWLDEQIEAFKADERSGGTTTAPVEVVEELPEPTKVDPPPRSTRRATARRASKRRHTARALKPDVKIKIVEYLAKNPQSTAGDVAKGLNLDRATVAGKLTELLRAGEIRKAKRGYVAA